MIVSDLPKVEPVAVYFVKSYPRMLPSFSQTNVSFGTVLLLAISFNFSKIETSLFIAYGTVSRKTVETFLSLNCVTGKKISRAGTNWKTTILAPRLRI